MKTWLAGLEQRTGLVGALRHFLGAPMPGGPRWRHAWSAALAFTFVLQVVTGFFLLAHYSASTQTAWESIYFLQYRVPGGWLVRALHSVSAQAFVVVLALHVMQMVLHQVYRAPRELNFLLLIGLLPLSIALSTTGWLLPLDQKGFWAARVPLNIMSVAPVVGPAMQRVLLGGADFSHHTLTRFVALHTTLLPALTGTLLAAYLYLTHRHRATDAELVATPAPARGYWPDQALKDAVACLVVLATVLFIVLRSGGGREPGVELLAPANPAESYSAARPEWFMLWLFHFLKLFPGGTEVWGAVVIPTLALLILAAMPWTCRWRHGARFNTGFILVVAVGVVVLSGLAIRQDRNDPTYAAAVKQAEAEAERARHLAGGTNGIPAAGALELVRMDPLSQGPRLFARHCASCHRFDGHDGLHQLPTDPPSAADLRGFASREWIAGLLDPARVATPHYFGGTKFAQGKMVKYVQKRIAGLKPESQPELAKVVAALSAEAQLPGQRGVEAAEAGVIEAGRALIRGKEFNCIECHAFRQPDDSATAPELTGYGSRAWLMAFLADPAHGSFYGRRNDRMPRFGAEGLLTPAEIGLLADWLRGDWP